MAGIWSRFQSLIFGGAIGAAASEAIAPNLEPARQHAWQQNQNRILEPSRLAVLVAQGAIPLATGEALAARNGFSKDQFHGFVQEALVAPPYAEVLDLWRRGKFGPPDPKNPPAEVTHALAKEQIEEQYWEPILELFYERLSAQEVALGIVRSILDDQGLQVGANDTSGGKVPAYPVSPINALDEAKSQGYDPERLRVLVGEIGLPMSLQQAASAYFRNIIELSDFYKAVAQGDTRPAWGPFILEQARQILTAHDYVELRLRGWFDTDQQMYDGTSKHGMSQEDTDLLFKVLGRPMAARQVFVAKRRGGIYDGPTNQIDPDFLKSLRESNIRPEWYNLEWAYRFTQPSVFVIRQYLKDGGDPAWAQTKLSYLGWEQSDIDIFIKQYGGTPAAGPAVTAKSATTNAARAIGRAYAAANISQAKAEADLTALGENVADYSQQFAAWTAQREAKLQGLSNVQVRNRFFNEAISQAEAIALLEGHGLTLAEATTYLGL